MATKGFVTVKSGEKVLMKVVAGCNGYNALKVADRLRESWPCNANDSYDTARELDFGCDKCLVVITDSEVCFKGVNEVPSLYRETFQQPEFNPHWKYGTADYMVVIGV